MKPQIRCTVVVPTYNCLEYLRSALATVAMQGVSDLEAIVVNDGSSDGTAEWLWTFARSAPWLRVIDLPGSSGPGKARNAAISVAKGSLIAFLDADDLWWPCKLERQLQHHEANRDVAFSFTDYVHFDPEGLLHGTCFDFWRPAYINKSDGAYQIVPSAEFEILGVNVVGTSTVVASSRALQIANGFPEDLQSAEDWLLWLKLAASSTVSCSSSVTMSYLMRPKSATANKGARIAAMRDIVAAYENRTEPAARIGRRQALARIHSAEAEQYQQEGAHWKAAAAHANAYIKRPDKRTARALVANLSATLFPSRHC